MYINKKSLFINLGIIIGVILIAFIILYIKSLNYPNPQEELVKCIAEKATLYVQEGCSHCLNQQKKFGEKLGLLEIVDCTKTPEKCVEKGIMSIPTWIFNDTHIKGVYELEELKEMMNC